MPTANLAWTNQSTGDSPDTTKVERSDGFPFGHANAPPPTVLVNSAAGGLNPTAANGSYADTTLTGDAYYSYRVSTVKGSEVATGIPTAMQFVYDPATDLGYPLGTPSAASTYNVSTAPFLHIDPERSSTGYADGDTMTNGYAGIVRYSRQSDGPWWWAANSYSSAPNFRVEDLDSSGNARKFFHNPASKVLRIVPDGQIECPDGITIFAVLNEIFYDFSTSEQVQYNHFQSGRYGVSSVAHRTGFSMMGSAIKSYTLSNPGPQYAVTVPGGQRRMHIMAWRINNSADAFNSAGGLNESGSIKGQAFDGGVLIGTTDELVGTSYHNGAASPDSSNHRLAAGFDSYYGMNFIEQSPSYYEGMTGEIMYFDSALDVTDMNNVFAYLGNKYEHNNITVIPAAGNSGCLHN